MALICKNGLSECSGCTRCTETDIYCALCKERICDGERYLLYLGAVICSSCFELPENDAVCELCGEGAYKDGISAGETVLCRRCAEKNIHIS